MRKLEFYLKICLLRTMQTVSIGAIIVQTEEQFLNSSTNQTVEAIRKKFQESLTDIQKCSTKYISYNVSVEKINLNTTNFEGNISSFKGCYFLNKIRYLNKTYLHLK